jgi:nucleoside-triphosphatase
VGRTLLLSGRPGVGKTSLIKAVADALGERAGGFYTEEIRAEGRREGFRLVTLDGHKAVMAHTDLSGQGRPRVSRYGVDLGALEQVGVAALGRAAETGRILVIDEIGKMELLSQSFRQAVLQAIEGPNIVLATVMQRANPWVDSLKQLWEVEVWEVSRQNRNQAAARVLAWIDR